MNYDVIIVGAGPGGIFAAYELSKNNMLLRLHDKNFPVVDMLDKFSEMNMEQVYDYFDFQLNDLFVGKTEKQKTYSLSTGYQESFDKELQKEIGYGIIESFSRSGP